MSKTNRNFIKDNFYAPNYIPINNNPANWNYDVIHYYNEYFASPQVTQNRRIQRNYQMYQQNLKESNKNVFQNPNKQFRFYYRTFQPLMFVYEPRFQPNLQKMTIYKKIDTCWCLQKELEYDKNDVNSCKLVREAVAEYISKP